MRTRTILVSVAAVLLSVGAVQAALINIDMVTVGDPGNAADTTGYGAVSNTYQMGKYDVTAAQYTAFLSAVAQTDTYGLYNSSMSGGPGTADCGITRTGSSGSYSYNTISSGYAVNNGNFPVNYVSWGDAARFVNWLTNGQPTGSQGAGTTETGSYTLNGATSDAALMAVTRNANAQYVIPTENEWYKAAYYKGDGTNAGYWVYPTQSNTAPSNVLSSTGTNNANFYSSGYTDPTNFLTVVGYFGGSPGPYGTYDMGGEVWQWNEANIDDVSRGLRGGMFGDADNVLQAAYRGKYDDPAGEYYGLGGLGFRVSEVPEPASMAFLALGGLALLRRRKIR